MVDTIHTLKIEEGPTWVTVVLVVVVHVAVVAVIVPTVVGIILAFSHIV